MSDSLARPRAGYIPTLDGWRAIAIAGVMLLHGGPILSSLPWLWGIQKLGASGVDLFFALSGILICSRLLDEEDRRGDISLRNFYLRRLFRIQPAAFAFLLVILLLRAAGMFPFTTGAWLSCVFSFRNLYSSTAQEPGFFYTGHFWSLAVEEHFYLVLPWLLILLRRRGRTLWLGVLAFAFLTLNELSQRFKPPSIGVSPELQSELQIAWLFLAAWLALLVRRPSVRARLRQFLPAGPSLALVCFVGLGTALGWKVVRHLWLPMLPFLVLSTVLHPQSWPSRMLEWAPLRWIGRVSYSLYLWQQIFCFGASSLPPAGWPLGWMQRQPQCYVIPLAMAFASYFIVEKPFVAWGHRLTRRPETKAAGVGVAMSSSRA